MTLELRHWSERDTAAFQAEGNICFGGVTGGIALPVTP